MTTPLDYRSPPPSPPAEDRRPFWRGFGTGLLISAVFITAGLLIFGDVCGAFLLIFLTKGIFALLIKTDSDTANKRFFLGLMFSEYIGVPVIGVITLYLLASHNR